MNTIKNFYYKTIKGVNLSLFKSGKDGVWYRREMDSKRTLRTLVFLRVLLFNTQERVLVETLKMVKSKFPSAEIVGRNIADERAIEIRVDGFSKYEQEQRKKELEDLLRKEATRWSCTEVVLGECFSS